MIVCALNLFINKKSYNYHLLYPISFINFHYEREGVTTLAMFATYRVYIGSDIWPDSINGSYNSSNSYTCFSVMHTKATHFRNRIGTNVRT